MAYVINKFSGEQLIVLEDGTIDTSTSIGLVGRNYVGYGETQNENFVFLLENFANDAPPSRPLAGQTWFNTINNVVYVYDGVSWAPVGAAVLDPVAPTAPNEGTLWLDTTADQLKIWLGSAWGVIGPEAVAGFGITRARSTSVQDSLENIKPVIILELNDTPIAICTAESFTINPNSSISGFSNNLIAGINLSSSAKINGSVTGNAGSADRLATARFINGVAFDGQQNITVKSSTTNRLRKGTYIVGNDFDGSAETTWAVDASSSNLIGKVVARNSEGGFSAGTISASFVGNLAGNVTATSGTSRFNTVEATAFIGATLSGNASTASQLATARRINGTPFNGTGDIVVSAEAGTLTGNTLNSTVTQSSLTAVGTLNSLAVSNLGATVGGAGEIRIFIDSSVPTIRSTTGQLNFDMGATGPDISFVNSSRSLSLGGPSAPAIIGDNATNLGIVGYKFDKVFANEFKGNADTATLAARATSIAGGGPGAIPFQSAAGTTAMLGLGAAGFVLKAQSSGIGWEALNSEQLNRGSYVNMINTLNSGSVSFFNSSVPVTISVDATTTNTANKVVARDASGNFSAGTITASLTGNVNGNLTGAVTGSVTGNAGSATQLATARTINGVAFDGTANITVQATDPTKVNLTGDSMTGFLTLHSNPIANNHAATKQYVDAVAVSLPGSLYDEFSTGVKSPGPQAFPERNIRGFSAYNSTDFPGSFFGGITVSGPSKVYSGQIAFNWNSEESAPTGLYFRVNDDTSDTSEWSAWQQVSTSAQLNGKIDRAGDTMQGFLTLAANPVNTNHAATKAYVDGRVPGFSFRSGASFSTSGFTNQVGSFNDGANFFDVFPPAGRSMGNLLAFIPSIHVIHFAGGVNADDSMRCTYVYFGDRIRVYVQNTEQRSTPAANWLAIWS
jgi:hypothetical protein